jgi:hypothetical protein
VAVWIILPGYCFYSAHRDNRLWPIDWLASTLIVKPPNFNVSAAPPDLTWYQALHWQINHFPVSSWLSEWRAGLTTNNIRWWVVDIVGLAFVGWLVLLCQDFRRQARAALMMLCTFMVLLVFCMAFRLYFKPLDKSIWMPRYLGFVWPAFAIAVCSLLMRLPFRPLRWSAIGLLIVVNLSQHWARVFAGSEPPIDVMAHDVVISQPPSDSRCYFDFTFKGPEPGEGSLFTYCGRYYLHIFSGKPIEPYELLRGYESKFEIWTPRMIPPFEMFVVNTVQDAPKLKQIIVWDSLRTDEVRTTDQITDKLADQWKLVNSNEFHLRDHWTWRDLITARRRVYQRKPVPATAPQPQPATQAAVTQ